MVAELVLASVIGLAGQPVSNRHVRSTEARILALLEQGVARSATLRRLVETLDASDVIVYLEPKFKWQTLDGYLAHRVIVAGEMRYLRIAVSTHGGSDRLMSVVAHELQHAIEVAEAPDVRDDTSLVRLFERSTIARACGGDCYETKAALEVQEAVLTELKTAKPALVAAGFR
jgi:AcrR family transcriptional regulator